jgi:predicted dehydrogenase
MGLLHACTLNVLPNVKLAALCDKSTIIRKICGKLFRGVQLTGDVEELSDLDLDAVYITTPIPSHSVIAKAVYFNKIARNVFVEKTLASNYRDAEELCKLAERAGGINMVGYMKRFAVTFKKAKDLLDRKVLGELVSFNAYAYSSDFAEAKETSNASASVGGVLGDLGSHAVDLALWFFGDFQVASANIKSLSGAGSEDFVDFAVRKADGLDGRFDISWCKREYRMPEFGLSIEGTEGLMKVNDDEVELDLRGKKLRTWYRHDLDDSVGFLLGAPEYFREDEHFIESILTARSAESSFHTAAKVDYVIDQVKREANKNE